MTRLNFPLLPETQTIRFANWPLPLQLSALPDWPPPTRSKSVVAGLLHRWVVLYMQQRDGVRMAEEQQSPAVCWAAS
jgi:hypothetical protein